MPTTTVSPRSLEIERLKKVKKVHPGNIFIKETKDKGRGVFAGKDIEVGEIIEICPVLRVPEDQSVFMDGTVIDSHWFEAGDIEDTYLVALGFGSLYNHSYRPNAYYVIYEEINLICYYARRKIRKGREIIVNYNGDPLDQTIVGFDVDKKTADLRMPDKDVHIMTQVSGDSGYEDPNGTWCGANNEDEPELRITKNTNEVTCVQCRFWIRNVVFQVFGAAQKEAIREQAVHYEH